MIGYIIVSIGNHADEDYICAHAFGDINGKRKVFTRKITAEKFAKQLQRDYDLDDPDNPYEFKIEEVEIIE